MTLTWTKLIGLTNAQANEVLRVSRRAEDNAKVKEATIARVVDGAAIVERFGWDGARLLDYPVRVPR